MDIKHRMVDVDTLRSRVCQDYLSLVISDNWRDTLKKYMDNERTLSREHKVNHYYCYKEQHRIMLDKGISNYRIEDMDVAFIHIVVSYCSVVAQCSDETLNCLSRIKNDRNTFMAHKTDNESVEILYRRALYSLMNIQDFVRSVDDNELQIDEKKRSQYRETYIKKTTDLRDLIMDERTNEFQIDNTMARDIRIILNSENPENKWCYYINKYGDESFVEQRSDDMYVKFVLLAAESGVTQSYNAAATQYRLNKDYSNEEYCLLRLYERNADSNDSDNMPFAMSMMRLAEIYFNGLSEHSGDGHSIIKNLQEKGYPIVLSSDGKRYDLMSNGKAVHSVEVNPDNSNRP